MAVHGGLKFLILRILKKQNKTGSQILSEIEEKTSWKPSCGSVYPMLADLSKKKLISFKKSSRKKVYSITKKGEDFLLKINKVKNEIISQVKQGINSLSFFQGKDKTNEILYSISQCDEKQDLFLPISKEILDLKNALLNCNIQKKYEKVRLLLGSTTKKIKKL